MTKTRALSLEMSRKCNGRHAHQQRIHGRAKDAAKCQPDLYKAICRGIMKERMERNPKIGAGAEIEVIQMFKVVRKEAFHDKDGCPQEIMHLYELTHVMNRKGDVSSALAWDDLTGMSLDAGKVIETGSKEVQTLKDKKVYDKIPRKTAQAQGRKVIKTRWIDMNKGDHENPVYRSRLAGKEFNTGEMEGIFVRTPPLEASRCLIHEAATITGGQNVNHKIIMVNDVVRAFFEAPAVRPICVEIPEEDQTETDRLAHHAGHLRMSLYGTRDAPMN